LPAVRIVPPRITFELFVGVTNLLFGDRGQGLSRRRSNAFDLSLAYTGVEATCCLADSCVGTLPLHRPPCPYDREET